MCDKELRLSGVVFNARPSQNFFSVMNKRLAQNATYE